MLTLTHENHFRFGYDGVPFAFRSSTSQRWFASYGRCDGTPGSFAQECLRAARLIRESTRDDLWTLFSGGIDSEVVIQSFKGAGIRAHAAILRFSGGYNQHDIRYAVEACERFSVPYRFFDLDLEEFFSSGLADEYAHATQSVSLQLLPTMWCMDHVPGYPILGSGDCYLVRRSQKHRVANVQKYKFSDELDPESESFDLWEKEKIAAWYRFLLWRDKPGCAGFFQYTPELMTSFLLDPLLEARLSNPERAGVSTQEHKFDVYRRHFDLVPRPKYNGYENVDHLDRRFRQRYEEAYGGHNSVFRTPLAELLRSEPVGG